MASYPDEPLPTVTLSLKEFNARAYEIFASGLADPNNVKFISFVLAGRTKLPNGQPARVVVDPTKGLEAMEDLGGIQLSRDYDSIIGISRTLPYTCKMAVFPLPNFKETMKRTNHLMKTIKLPVRNCKIRVCSL